MGGKDRTVMLSAQLLRILRVYWRPAKPQCGLYPDRDAHRPIDTQVLCSACRSARAAAGIDKRVTVHTPRRYLPRPTSPECDGKSPKSVLIVAKP